MAKKFLPLIRIFTPNDSRCHLVDREKFVIGRSPGVEILLTTGSISRKHLSVEIKGQEILIEDLGSANGSFLSDMRLEPGKKYPLPARTPVRLGNSGETITVELMDRPVEFGDYKNFLSDFNRDLQNVMAELILEGREKANLIIKEAQVQVANAITSSQAQAQGILQQAKAQADSSLEAANVKSHQIVKEAEEKAEEVSDRAKRNAIEEAHALKEKIKADSEAEIKEKVEKAKAEAEKIHREAIYRAQENAQTELEQLRQKAHHDIEMKRQEETSALKEQLAKMKLDHQVEADQTLQNAHKEAQRIKETAVQEAEKIKSDAQAFSQKLHLDTEAEVKKQLQQTREAAEKIRQSAQQDFDETVARGQSKGQDLLHQAETEAAMIIEKARAKAAQIVENQEQESHLFLKNLKAAIESEAKIEAQRILKSTEDQVAHQRAEAQKEVDSAKATKALLESDISQLTKASGQLLDEKGRLQEDLKKIQSDLVALREETSRQHDLNAKLVELEKELQALELKRAQIQERNRRSEEELDLLKRSTLSELDRIRRAEEVKILQMASLKAKDFSTRIESLVIHGLNEKLDVKLTPAQANELCHQIFEELNTLFASEAFKHDEKVSMAKQGEVPTPSFFKNKAFRWGVAAAAVAGVVFLAKNSKQLVQMQDQLTEKLIVKQRDDATYKPAMTPEYRQTYTDNILYMEKYLALKNDEKVQEQWALNLSDFFFKDLRLNEEVMVRFIGLESALIKRLSGFRDSVDLRYLEEGIMRMREAEREEVAKIHQLLNGPVNYEKLRVREKIFLAQMSALQMRQPSQAFDTNPSASAPPPEVREISSTPETPASFAEPEASTSREASKARRRPTTSSKQIPRKLPAKKTRSRN
ncbi:MAG: FHA domain-containing protein [Pseudobdellovibrionaceae bacterium]